MEGPGSGTGEDDWLSEFELTLVERFGWSIKDIDESDTESLLRFSLYAANKPQKSTGSAPTTGGAKRRVGCDQVSWL